MPKWVKRLREIAARNPDALPMWLRNPAPEKAWYRITWQTDGGVPADDAARPVIVMLNWLASRKKLTRQGMAVLKSAQAGDIGSLALTHSLVDPIAACFLIPIGSVGGNRTASI